MSTSLPEIEALARSAGDILKAGFITHPGFGRDHIVNYKGEIDLVTEIDQRSEDFLIGEIRRKYPDDQIITEESGHLEAQGNCKWYIDPLDGTINYAHGLPNFSVSIGYEVNGEMKYGVVYDPMLDECFSAEIGRGAWLNGLPIRTSEIDSLKRSLLVTGFAYDTHSNPRNNLEEFNNLTLKTQGVRRLGSAALDLSYVAAGRLEGFWELRMKQWDLAAGVLIVKEAGGIVTGADGGPDFFEQPCSVLAANPHLHPRILEVVQQR